MLWRVVEKVRELSFRRCFSSVSAAFAPRWASLAWLVLGAAVLGLGTGCGRFRPKPSAQYVYVTAKQTFLRDRVAAVSNRTGTVENGQRLQILDTGRRFFKVKTDQGEVGWIDEKAVVTQSVYDEFKALGEAHKEDTAVASAVVRDEVNLHLKPGRDTERFYRLAEGDKLQLLQRATLPKPVPGGTVVQTKTLHAEAKDVPAPPPPIAMEDWWLVKDGKGRAGWLVSRMLEVDAPDTLTRYAEGQRFVGAYVLGTVHDEGAEGEGIPASKDIPEYLTVLSPYLAGLPYDFDQVRVFTWNTKVHRYETAFREKNIEGYLPLKISMAKDPYGRSALAQTPLPTFTYRVLAGDASAVVPDPATGSVVPGRTIAKTYRLEGNLVRRVAAAGAPKDDEAHPVEPEKKSKSGKKR